MASFDHFSIMINCWKINWMTAEHSLKTSHVNFGCRSYDQSLTNISPKSDSSHHGSPKVPKTCFDCLVKVVLCFVPLHPTVPPSTLIIETVTKGLALHGFSPSPRLLNHKLKVSWRLNSFLPWPTPHVFSCRSLDWSVAEVSSTLELPLKFQTSILQLVAWSLTLGIGKF